MVHMMRLKKQDGVAYHHTGKWHAHTIHEHVHQSDPHIYFKSHTHAYTCTQTHTHRTKYSVHVVSLDEKFYLLIQSNVYVNINM